MKILIISVGKKHDPNLAEAIKDYSSRMSHFAVLEWNIVQAEKFSNPEKSKQAESEKINKILNPSDLVVLMDERGSLVSTDDLLEIISDTRNKSYKRMVIIIGGSRGVAPTLFSRADKVISLSKMTFPHQIARLIVVEQLYRCHSMLENQPYHHQ